MTFSSAGSADEERIRELLQAYGLPYEDIAEHLDHFIVAEMGADLVGVVGLEVHGTTGLLRSLAVADAHRGKGIAKDLYTRILAHAHLQGVRELYLLTTTAEGFFSRLGFDKTNRDEVSESISATKEFKSLCPSTAVCMAKSIDEDARYYPKDALVLQPDVPSAQVWGIALDKTMLTYFEVEPGCTFEMHTHESEQITMVLEGELFFDVDVRTVAVRSGEVIAIPSSVPHAVFTRSQSVKAIDAWSPPMGKYRRSCE